MIILPFIIVALLVHFWGTRRNKNKARKWMAVHAPVLDSEFALVGFTDTPKITPYPEGVQSAGLLETSAKLTAANLPADMLKEKSAYEFESYASGRLNVAFMDVKIKLAKWYNPFLLIAENVAGLFFESIRPDSERMEAIIYSFDGSEKDFVAPRVPGSEELEKSKPIPNSSYAAFIFAIVNKTAMRKLRDQRYDLSLTFTRDSPKLPAWTTVMSESAEITDVLLTKDLIAAIEKAGDLFEYLIVTDQPVDKPTTLDETEPKKRLQLCLSLPSNGDYLPVLPVFLAFIRLSDHLASAARFRPEVLKKVNATRETERSKLKKVSDQVAEEERREMADKMRKEERDRKLKGLSAEEQRKFLEKESARDRKKQEKKMTKRG